MVPILSFFLPQILTGSGHGASRRRGGWILWVLAVWGGVLGAGQLPAQSFPVRVQTIDLKKGWNAVFLEVEPLDTKPTAIFEGTPVDVVAQFTRPVRATQFETDPGKILENNDAWAVWYAPAREESFLSGLYGLHSHNALLVHSREAFQWKVTGQVYLKRIFWKADSFNLVGFPVNPAVAPTFAQYFEGKPAHAGKPVFRIVDGVWRKVENPASTVMKRGEAYWVYCQGGSDYQGPAEVQLAYGDHLRYTADLTTSTLVLKNRSLHPAGTTISQSAQNNLPMAVRLKGVMDSGIVGISTPLPAAYTMPAMEAGASGTMNLQVGGPTIPPAGGSNLLRISSDAGTEYWVAAWLEPRD